MSTSSYVALLRGINVGGKNKLPMKELAALFEEAGCSDVRTYIQSGNVIFRASAKLATGLEAVLEKQIQKRFGFAVPVIVRSAWLRSRAAGSRASEAAMFLRPCESEEAASCIAPSVETTAQADPAMTPQASKALRRIPPDRPRGDFDAERAELYTDAMILVTRYSLLDAAAEEKLRKPIRWRQAGPDVPALCRTSKE